VDDFDIDFIWEMEYSVLMNIEKNEYIESRQNKRGLQELIKWRGSHRKKGRSTTD